MGRPHRIALILAVGLSVLAAGVTLAEHPNPDRGDIGMGTVDGVRYRREERAIPIAGIANPIAGCGAGSVWTVVGGGGRVNEMETSWQSGLWFRGWPEGDASRDDGIEAMMRGPGGGLATAYVICVRDIESKVVHLDVAAQTTGDRSATVRCGWRWRPAGGSTAIGSVDGWIVESRPWDGPDRDALPDDGWTARAWDPSGGTSAFSVTVACIKGRPVRYAMGTAAIVPPSATISRTAGCKGVEHVIGGGVEASGPAAGVRTVVSFPFDTGDADTIPDDQWQVRVMNVSEVSQVVRAWAACLGPAPTPTPTPTPTPSTTPAPTVAP